MRLRLELQLFLWVTATALVVTALFRGGPGDASLDFYAVPMAGDDVTISSSASGAEAGTRFLRTISDVDQLGSTYRPIFYVSAPLVSAQPTHVESVPRILPILKGIISSGGEWRAVFHVQSDSGAYVSASVGDEVAGVAITAVNAASVVARDVDGDILTFELRGAGEGNSN